MIELTESAIDAMAPNADAAKNGRGLVLKGKFNKLHKSDDSTLLFGECQGSGKEPYRCSSDFARPEQPTHRCNCPSRQFPCKHSLGLMYAFALKRNFTVAAVPEDLQAKREKLQTRAEKKTEEPAKPKKVNTNALAKKVQAQLDGIDVLEKLTHDLVRLGIGNMNAKIAKDMEEQAKQLGNAYLPGAQNALRGYTRLFQNDDGDFETSASRLETIHTDALDQLARLHALIKQGRTYLKQRLDDPELALPTDTAIAAWLGHAWQLTELKAAGLVEENVELIQLAFTSYDDRAREELVDTGIWMNLATGKIRHTLTLRPYKALKHIKSEDSFFDVAKIKELCVYPGGTNPRIRWDGMLSRNTEPKDFQAIRRFAGSDFAAIAKEVKASLKGPLADKHPIYALNFTRLGKVGDTYLAEDAKGERLALTDLGIAEEPPSCDLLSLVPAECLKGQTLIARFRHDMDTKQLRIKPLSLVMPDRILRLTM